MWKCKEGVDCRNPKACCLACKYKDECEDVCGEVGEMESPSDCVDAYLYVEQDAPIEGQLTLFEKAGMELMKKIADLDRQKKELEKQDKSFREALQMLMDTYCIKSFDNDILRITYIEPTTRTTLDSTRLKKDYPELAEKYSKTSEVKATVRIEVKK